MKNHSISKKVDNVLIPLLINVMIKSYVFIELNCDVAHGPLVQFASSAEGDDGTRAARPFSLFLLWTVSPKPAY